MTWPGSVVARPIERSSTTPWSCLARTIAARSSCPTWPPSQPCRPRSSRYRAPCRPASSPPRPEPADAGVDLALVRAPPRPPRRPSPRPSRAAVGDRPAPAPTPRQVPRSSRRPPAPEQRGGSGGSAGPGERLAEHDTELVPLDEEGVVALGRGELTVGGADTGSRRRINQRMDLRRAVQDVAGDPQAGQPGAGRRQRAERGHAAAPVPADVVKVHRPDQDPVRGGVETFHQLATLVVEIAGDRQPAVGLQLPPEAAI